MARTRTGSAEPGRRVRDISQPLPETHTRVARGSRNKSASPGPSVIARRTQFRRDQPTPIRPQVTAVQQQPGQGTNNNKVVKKTGRTGGKRAKSVESEERTSREGSVASSSGGGAGIGPVREILPLVPEGNEEEQPPPDASRYIPPPNARQSATSISILSSLSPFSSPEPEATGTQLEVEDMDVDLMLETFPDLDSHAKKLLDLLILNPPVGDLLRNLRVPGSKSSKRLRLYEQSFTASKGAYGTSKYLSAHHVEVALHGNTSFNPLLYKSNLAVLAIFTHTAQEWGDGTFEELKEIEREFPSQFGDVVHERNFQAALDLRTQTLVLGLIKSQDADSFNPDTFLRHFFLEADDDQEEGITQVLMDKRIKPWVGMKEVVGWEDQVVKRIKQIRTTFSDSKGELVDFEKLTDLFSWNKFVERMSDYVKVRLTEIKTREDKTIGDLIDDARNPRSPEPAKEKIMNERARSEIPESVQEEQPTAAATPESDAEPSPQYEVSYPNLPEAEADVDVESVEALQEAARDDMERLNLAPFKQLKKRLERQERESLESPGIVVNVAQVKNLKRRKTEPSPQKAPKVQVTPRVASLGSQGVVGNNIAEAKFLKGLKSRASPSQRQLEYDGDIELGSFQEPLAPRAKAWLASLKNLGKLKNKENDKSVALMLPPSSPPRGVKRKRFIDYQEGATRVSQIDEDMPRSPAKRQQVHKGKNRSLPTENEEEEREPRHSKEKGRLMSPIEDQEGRISYGNKGKNRPQPQPEYVEENRPNYASDEDEDEDENEDMFEQDQRKENEDRLKKSRRNIPSTSTASTSLSAPVRASNSSVQSREQSIVRPEDNQHQITRNRSSKSSRASREEPQINVNTLYEEEEEEEEREEEREEDDDDSDSDSDSGQSNKAAPISRKVNRLAKEAHVKKVSSIRKTRKLWGDKESDLLIQKIGEIGCRWAIIRDMRIPEFSGRTDVQLKDKARNIKIDFLKARVPLPHNFEHVTISRKQIEVLKDMGIDPEYDEYFNEN